MIVAPPGFVNGEGYSGMSAHPVRVMMFSFSILSERCDFGTNQSFRKARTREAPLLRGRSRPPGWLHLPSPSPSEIVWPHPLSRYARCPEAGAIGDGEEEGCAAGRQDVGVLRGWGWAVRMGKGGGGSQAAPLSGPVVLQRVGGNTLSRSPPGRPGATHRRGTCIPWSGHRSACRARRRIRGVLTRSALLACLVARRLVLGDECGSSSRIELADAIVGIEVTDADVKTLPFELDIGIG